MARAATRTSNVYTRVDPETKAQAEAILDQLGIPMSNAIGMFLKQIVMHRGIPFDMKMQKGMDDIAVGRISSIDSVEEEMRRLYGI